jgi:hypothetical protein
MSVHIVFSIQNCLPTKQKPADAQVPSVTAGMPEATSQTHLPSQGVLLQATREGLTGVEVPPVVEEPVPVPRGRPLLRALRRKSAPAKTAKPAAKPEPWMFPPPHAWTHRCKPDAAGAQPTLLLKQGPSDILPCDWTYDFAHVSPREWFLNDCSGSPACCKAAQG